VLESLEYLKNEQPKRATLYYLSPEKVMLTPGGDFDVSFVPHTERQKLYKEIVKNAQFVARFDHLGAERPGTSASASKQLKLPPEPQKTHERLKKILKKKKNQLPKGERNPAVGNFRPIHVERVHGGVRAVR
jgi:hypothetical protein